MNLRHHLGVLQLVVDISRRHMLVERQPSMQVGRIPSSVLIVLVQLVVDEPFPSLSCVGVPVSYARIADLPLFALPVVECLVCHVAARSVDWSIILQLAALSVIALPGVKSLLGCEQDLLTRVAFSIESAGLLSVHTVVHTEQII